MIDHPRLELSREETFLLLTCLPYLDGRDDDRLAAVVAPPFEWDRVLWRAESLRTIPLAWHHLTRLGLENTIPDDVAAYLDSWSSVSSVRSKLVLDEIVQLTGALDAAGIEHFVFKGSALAATVYPEPLVRPMLDLDVMVRPWDVPRVRQLLLERGHLHAFWDPDSNALTPLAPHQLAEYAGEHYELPIFLRLVDAPLPVTAESIPRSWRHKHLKFATLRGNLASFPLFVDVHINLSIDFDPTDVWAGARPRPMLGRSIVTQSPTGIVWFLAARLYHEAFQLNTCKLSMLGDLQAVLHVWGDEVDWDELTAVTIKYGMQPALFYVLTHVRTVGHATVDEEVLERLRPDRLPIPSSHDWGDVITKLLPRCVVFDLVLAEPNAELRYAAAGDNAARSSVLSAVAASADAESP